jgi:hypothetical protein
MSVSMADIQDLQQHPEDAIASSDEKGMSTEHAMKTVGSDQHNNDKETGPSNMVTRARQSLSDLFTIVTPPKSTSTNENNANDDQVRGWLCPNLRWIPE